MRVAMLDMPASVWEQISADKLALEQVQYGDSDLDYIHLFVKEKNVLEATLKASLQNIVQNGMIWVSWPKKASKIPTDITEDTIRELCLPMGLVDIKVCAVDAIWSGLKLVIRKELRR